MVLWKLIVGILLVVAVVTAIAVSIVRTPENLRGFYGAMFWTIGIIGIVGGIALAVTAFM